MLAGLIEIDSEPLAGLICPTFSDTVSDGFESTLVESPGEGGRERILGGRTESLESKEQRWSRDVIKFRESGEVMRRLLL